MTADNIVRILKDTGIEIDLDHPDHIDIDKIETLLLPFAEVTTSENQFYADGKVYLTNTDVTIKFYSDRQLEKDLDVQRAVSTLEAYGLRISRVNSDEYFDGDGLYLNEYSTEV